MKKNDFVKYCCEKVGLSQKDMREVLSIIGECIATAMKDDGGVTPFEGFKFYSTFAEGHYARNPKTGEQIYVEGKYKPKARFSDSVKSKINN